MIAGYSLAHNQVFAPVFGETLSYLPKVKELGFIEQESEVVIGQKCLRAECQKGGLMGKMDRILYNHLCTEFKYYLASIAIANENSVHYVTSKGYTKVYGSATRMYFIQEMKVVALGDDAFETKMADGKMIQYRFARSGDIPQLQQLNHEFLKENRADLSHGYLAAVFSEDNWQYMIDRKWVVLAEIL